MIKGRRCFGHRHLVFLAMFIFALSGAGICNAETTLAIPSTPQEHSQWCWAGASKAVLDYYQHNVSQGTIANWAWGRSDCNGNTNFNWVHTCNQPNYMYGTNGSLQGILANWGVNSTARTYALSQATCVAEINAGRPFIMRFGWTSGGGHFLDGYGYDQIGANNYLNYMDPWPGNGYTKSLYSWVVSASGHSWTHSLQITTPSAGTAVINPDPNSISAAWTLTGSNSYSRTGAGDLTLNNLAPGNYTITWGTVAGWTKPSPATSTQTLLAGGTVTFTGTYARLIGDIDGNGAVDIRDAILAMQVISGMTPAQNINVNASVIYGDKIGMPEAIYILQKVAGAR